MEDCLALAGAMHAIYMSVIDSLQRICNQAFFDRINVYVLDGGDFVEASLREPFGMLLDPSLHAAAWPVGPGCVRERMYENPLTSRA